MTLAWLGLANPAYADEEGFQRWLTDFRVEARAAGISPGVLDDAFDGAVEDERVIELDRKQPESRLTLEQYQAKVLTARRVEEGRRLYGEHRALLEKVAVQYGVPAPYIVALWGVETSYGDNTGNFEVIGSLATLAYEGRRAEFFRRELLNVLTIMQQDHYPAAQMTGSWAGAMGQCQFMPSSYLKYAVDYNADGKRDIWETEADIFASIANYLSSEGWQAGEGWRSHDAKTDATNYKILLKWNRSRYFATTVGMLADEIGKGR